MNAYTPDWSVLWSRDYGHLFVHGALLSLLLTAVCLALSLLLGIGTGILRWNGGWFSRRVLAVYVEFVRNTPPLVQILAWYFSASYLLPVSIMRFAEDVGLAFGSVVVALTFYHGAFFAEVMRGSLGAIPGGQMSAALALGLSRVQAIRLIVLPQALRIALPSLLNEVLSLAKNTSLAMAIGVAEMTYAAKYVDTYAFRGIEGLAAATLFYLVLCSGLSVLGRLLDVRLQVPG